MSEFAEALATEIAKLESELEHDVRFQRLRELWKVATLYGEHEAFIAPSVAPRTAVMTRDSAVPRRRRASPDRERAVAEAKTLLHGRTSPTSTAAILDHLNAIGVVVQGERPVNNLSAMLSTSGEFTPNGRAGWTLKQPEMADRQPETADIDAEHGELESAA